MSLSLFDLTGRTALITGGTQGLGLSIARGLGQAGARLVINARNPDKLAKAIDQLSAEGLDCRGGLFDVSQPEQVEGCLNQLEQDGQYIDILVNNAGIIRRQPLTEMSPEDFRQIVDTNLLGSFVTSQAVARQMIRRGQGGKIITMCSMMSELARPNVGAYAASKGALKMLTKNMAAEWARHNIQVNGIGPGYFITDLTEALVKDETFNNFIINRTPAARWGKPEELVGAAVFLSSRASDFVNGHIVYVDGGILAVL